MQMNVAAGPLLFALLFSRERTENNIDFDCSKIACKFVILLVFFQYLFVVKYTFLRLTNFKCKHKLCTKYRQNKLKFVLE